MPFFLRELRACPHEMTYLTPYPLSQNCQPFFTFFGYAVCLWHRAHLVPATLLRFHDVTFSQALREIHFSCPFLIPRNLQYFVIVYLYSLMSLRRQFTSILDESVQWLSRLQGKTYAFRRDRLRFVASCQGVWAWKMNSH